MTGFYILVGSFRQMGGVLPHHLRKQIRGFINYALKL